MNRLSFFGHKSPALKAVLWPLGIFVLALLPRLIDLGSRSFWLDEVFTLDRAALAPAALVINSFQNHHMPWFFLLLAPLTHMAHPEYWLRLPSAIFGAISVVLVFMIATRIAGRLAGVFAALYLGLSPAALGFAQEARSYTLITMLVLIALYGVTRLAEDWRNTKIGWVCYTLGTAAALVVLGDSLPWLIAANLIFVCLLAFVPEPKRFIRRVVIADLAILPIAAPFYMLMLHYQAQGFADSMEWIPRLSLAQIWYSFGSVYLMHVPDWVSFQLLAHHTVPGLVWLIDLLLLTAVAAAVWRLCRWPAMLITQGVSFLFLPCLFLLISITHPILLPRYLLWSAAPFAILVGVGAKTLLESLTFNKQKYVVLTAMVLLALNTIPYYKDELKPNWNVAAQRLAEEVSPGDVVIFSDTGAVPILKFYLPTVANSAILSSPYANLADAQAALEQGKRVWIVYGHAGQSTTTHTEFLAQFQPLGAPHAVQKAGGRITILLYDPKAGLASYG